MKILIRMKRYSIIMMSILFMFISCAEEGPYKMGQLECSVKYYIGSTYAIISVKLPQNNENLLNGIRLVGITDRPLNNYEAITNSQIIKPVEVINDDNASEECMYLFDGLLPNTTYYCIFDASIDYNVGYRYGDGYIYGDGFVYYYPESSFTTTKEGDYSEIADYLRGMKPVVFFYDLNDDETYIQMNNPIHCWVTGYFYASTSPNFENSVKSQFIDYTNNNLLMIFPKLEKEKYFFKFEGDIVTMLGDSYVEYENLSILFPDPIDLTNY